MQMVSTKTEPKMAEAYVDDQRPRIHLDDDLVRKLGIKGIPAPGTTFALQAVAVAERVSAEMEEPDEKVEEGKAGVYLCLVLTDIGLQQAAKSAEQVSGELYGG